MPVSAAEDVISQTGSDEPSETDMVAEVKGMHFYMIATSAGISPK
ncbi:MAG: hypothetical protein HPY66_0800 [Firmicutes bacterium]|nr:hypothetical protein [Bacillota bacterium]